MLASKYYFFFAPLPLLVWFTLRQCWRVPLRRWLALGALAAAAWLAVNWTPLMPSTWAYLADHLAGRHVVTPSLFFMGEIFVNLPLRLVDGLPPSFYFVFAAAKLTPLVLALALAGIAISLKQRNPAQRVALVWIGFWFLVWLCSGGKYGRYFVSVLPAFLLFAAHAVAEIAHAACGWVCVRKDALPAPLQSAVAPIFAVIIGSSVALAAAAVGSEARAALVLAPHHRFYVSPLLGGEAKLDWLFPHCDYFDAGFREAVQEIAAHAEAGAELTSEIDLPAAFFAARAGRPDLRVTLLRPDQACRGGGPCYVIVQPGRIYLHNRDAISRLSRRAPWQVQTIRGHAAATVYRLESGESPFAGEDRSSTLD